MKNNNRNKILESLIQSVVEETIDSELNYKRTIPLLIEADLKKVNPGWLGTYAFVLAYNDGIGQGLFPRHQPMNIEFDDKLNASEFKSGTVYVNPRTNPDASFFRTGTGHDMLHGITQNIQVHFGAGKKWDEKEKERQKATRGITDFNDMSKANLSRFSYQKLRSLIDYTKKNIGIDFDKLYPEKPIQQIRQEVGKTINPVNKQKFMDGVRTELTKDRIKKNSLINSFIENEIDKLNDKPEPSKEEVEKRDALATVYRAFQTNHRTDYWKQSISKDKTGVGKGKSNATHAIEEEMGNIVSDSFIGALKQNREMDDSEFKGMIIKLNNLATMGEFGTFNDDMKEPLFEKWRVYLTDIMPKFVELYNKRVNQLKNQTKFGKEFL